MSSERLLRIRLVRSPIGYRADQRAAVRSLGLRRMHQVVERPDTPIVRGQIFKVQHLLKVEEV
jgi:large subunit ribosomal protein L30